LKSKKKYIKKGMQQVRALKAKSDAVNEQSLAAIIQNGADKFQEQTGRPMTYGEMREMYG
jgi:hypothetical protein